MDYFKPFSRWFYRGEGNKSLVISNPSTRKVLRLRKNSAKQANEWTQRNGKTPSNIREELTRNVNFCREIFLPLLGEKYVHPGTLVDLPKDFVAGINGLVTHKNRQRPLHRLTKEVTADCELGVLLPDACFVSDCPQNNLPEARPTFSVEIKPKSGVLPNCNTCRKPDDQSSSYCKVKQLICKYCLIQWRKVNKEGKYHRRSGYCPLDLFSNDTRRVLYAMVCLIKDPQNNLRIFEDGTLLYSGETNVPLPNGTSSTGKAPYIDSTPLASNPVPNDDGKLLHLEEKLRSSFGSNCCKTIPCNLFGQGDGTLSFDQCTMFIITILQLLVDDSNKGCSLDCDTIPNPPVCTHSCYKDSDFINNNIQSYLDSSGTTFGKSGVLNKILEVQKLDKLGTDEVLKIYNDVCNNASLDDIFHTSKFTLEHPSINEPDGDLIAKQLTLKYFEDESVHHQSVPSMRNSTVPKSSQVSIEDESVIASKLNDIVKFLIAATANDCSIMISFQQVDDAPTDSTCYIKEAVTGLFFKYSMAVVDLDPKSLSRIPKYNHEYHEIIENYLEFSDKSQSL